MCDSLLAGDGLEIFSSILSFSLGSFSEQTRDKSVFLILLLTKKFMTALTSCISLSE